VADAAAGTPAAVAFYKPEGLYNQHPGYANVADADQRSPTWWPLQASPQWKHMVIVHHLRRERRPVGPRGAAARRQAGPGHPHPGHRHLALRQEGHGGPHAYDTGSVLRLITRRFGLPTLPGLAAATRR
jgi:acid phosphatase